MSGKPRGKPGADCTVYSSASMSQPVPGSSSDTRGRALEEQVYCSGVPRVRPAPIARARPIATARHLSQHLDGVHKNALLWVQGRERRKPGTDSLEIRDVEPSPRRPHTLAPKPAVRCLSEAVPKVPEGCLGGFWHFWHPLTVGIPKVMLLGKGTGRILVRKGDFGWTSEAWRQGSLEM
jgi:hypothetical protein